VTNPSLDPSIKNQKRHNHATLCYAILHIPLSFNIW
jgi:hypothetical protein